MLRPTVAAIALTLASQAAIAGDVLKLDFGPDSTPVADGFTQVTPGQRYTAEAGLGFLKRGQLPLDISSERGGLPLTPLTRDAVVNPRQFRIDRPDGEYHVTVFTGSHTSVYVRGQFHHMLIDSRWIRQGKQELYSLPMSIEQFYGPAGPYFRSYATFYRPGQSLWRRYMERHFPVIRFPATVQAGALVLEFSPWFGLNAMIVAPAADKPEADALVERITRARQEAFDSQYVYVPSAQAANPLAPTAAERGTGMVLFARHPMRLVYPETVPARTEVGQALRGIGAKGSHICLQIGCVPTRDLGAIAASVSDLRGPGVIPASAVDVRYARYMEFLDRDQKHYTIKPSLLTKQGPVPADGGVARAFLLTVAVPADAAPGIYRGHATIRSGQAGADASLPVEVAVLPFALPAIDIAVGGYYSTPVSTRLRPYRFAASPGDDAFYDLAKRQVTSQFAMMREMGCNYVSTTASWRPFQVDENGQIKTNDLELKHFVLMGDAARDAGFEQFTFFGIGWTMLMNYCPGFLSRDRAAKLPIDQIVFPESAKAPAAKLIKRLYELADERSWPTMHFYVSDELGNMGIRGRHYGRELARFFKEVKPMVGRDFKLLATSLRFQISEQMMPSLDIAQPNAAWPINEQTVAAARKAGVELWTYNMGPNRNSYGYYQWKIGSRGRVQWTFDWSETNPDPYFGFGGGAAHCTVDPHFGCIPSHQWFVVYREGLTDYRYVQLLEAKIKAQPRSAAAAQARKVLEELGSRLSMSYTDEINTWHPATYDYFRWQLAKAIAAFD